MELKIIPNDGQVAKWIRIFRNISEVANSANCCCWSRTNGQQCSSCVVVAVEVVVVVEVLVEVEVEVVVVVEEEVDLLILVVGARPVVSRCPPGHRIGTHPAMCTFFIHTWPDIHSDNLACLYVYKCILKEREKNISN